MQFLRPTVARTQPARAKPVKTTKPALVSLITAALFAISPTSFAQSQATKNVVLYCPAPGEWCTNVANDFTKASGIHVDVLRKSAGEVLAQVRAEAAKPKADLWWGGISDSHLAAAAEGLTIPYETSAVGQLAPWSQAIYEASGKHAIGTYAIALGIGYNPELLAKKKIAAPKCWSDLIKPEYKGEIQMPNPNSSGTAYQMIASLVQMQGENQAFDYLKKLHQNVNTYTRSGVAPGKAVARGETGVGVNYLQDMLVEQQAGFPIKISAPCEGTALGVDAMSIIKGAPNLANAKLFYDWLISVPGQESGARSGLLHSPAHLKARQPSQDPELKSAKYIDYDFKRYGSTEERQRLLKRWEAEVNSMSR
ncbi:MAG: ABC transporter substrate-binding protein [Pseudomonadota bacterium]|nr:ABC transporter substrate-binding protein [Pseudomonadota bacterium]